MRVDSRFATEPWFVSHHPNMRGYFSLFSVDAGRSPLCRILVLWVALGQLVMIFLLLAPPFSALEVLTQVVSEVIPGVGSIKSLPVFDQEIAATHHALLWVLSPLLLVLFFVVPISPADVAMLPKKKNQVAILIFILIMGVLLLAFDGVYVGFYTFGIYKLSLGFAFLSSFQVAYIPAATYLIRFLVQKRSILL